MNQHSRVIQRVPYAGSAKVGVAWMALCLAFVAHVFDEAITHFLSVYNPTVISLQERFSWFPMPVFRFADWLAGLMVLNLILLLLSPFAFRGARWLRPVVYVFAMIMLLNGLAHTLGTIFGRTVESVHFPRPMPGFYSSPLLLAASIYLLWQLQASAKIAETP